MAKKNETLLKIHTYGDPVLRELSAPVEMITPQLQQLARDMLTTMYEADGVGLAAPQVGENIRLIVIDLSREEETRAPLILFNPEIFPDETGEVELAEEGCLSVPGLWAEVPRYETVQVKGLNIEGEAVHFQAKGHLARAVQHEVDHLDGRLFIDRINPTERAMLKSKLKKMARQRT